jgi:transcription initiation factor TFIIB
LLRGRSRESKGNVKPRRCSSNGTCGLKGDLVPCELSRLAARMSIPEQVRENSGRICSSIVERRLIIRRPLEVIAASSIYTACRESRTPITLKDLAVESGLEPWEIGRFYRLIAIKLKVTPPVPNGTRYVERVATKVGASDEARRLSLEIEKRSIGIGLGDRNPMTLAGAAVYTACLLSGEGKTQWEIAEAAGIGEGALRTCARDMRKLFPLHGHQ